MYNSNAEYTHINSKLLFTRRHRFNYLQVFLAFLDLATFPWLHHCLPCGDEAPQPEPVLPRSPLHTSSGSLANMTKPNNLTTLSGIVAAFESIHKKRGNPPPYRCCCRIYLRTYACVYMHVRLLVCWHEHESS